MRNGTLSSAGGGGTVDDLGYDANSGVGLGDELLAEAVHDLAGDRVEGHQEDRDGEAGEGGVQADDAVQRHDDDHHLQRAACYSRGSWQTADDGGHECVEVRPLVWFSAMGERKIA